VLLFAIFALLLLQRKVILSFGHLMHLLSILSSFRRLRVKLCLPLKSLALALQPKLLLLFLKSVRYLERTQAFTLRIQFFLPPAALLEHVSLVLEFGHRQAVFI
jgi:hypothetical protein